MKTIKTTLLLATILLLSGCADRQKQESITQSAMKCGAGKCGASMMNGSALLVKKKTNILNQLQEDDSRRQCVLNATSTKALYACVRAEDTGRLSKNETTTKPMSQSAMKCGAGKCGGGM